MAINYTAEDLITEIDSIVWDDDLTPLVKMHRVQGLLYQHEMNCDDDWKGILPDAKAQVTWCYGKNVAKTIVVSTQHSEDLPPAKVEGLVRNVVNSAIPPRRRQGARLLINPTGRFVIGGPVGDAGVTGRKIIVDTYGV